MLDSFLQYIEHEKRYSVHTVQAYKTDLLCLTAYLHSQYNCSITSSTLPMLRSWVMSLAEKNNSGKTINRKISSVRSYFKFLIKRNQISSDPSKNLLLPKVSRNLPQFIQEQELNNLLDSPLFSDSFGGTRDKIILELFYGTGIRLSELINLKNQDIYLDQKKIKVRGKGNKERIIPIHTTLSLSISTYLSRKKSELKPIENKHFIVTDKGKPTYPMYVYRVVKKYLGLIYSSQKKSPHVLRHTFATHLLNKGADLNAIKDLLGHTSLASTQVYTHNSLDKLKQVFNQAHPKA